MHLNVHSWPEGQYSRTIVQWNSLSGCLDVSILRMSKYCAAYDAFADRLFAHNFAAIILCNAVAIPPSEEFCTEGEESGGNILSSYQI